MSSDRTALDGGAVPGGAPEVYVTTKELRHIAAAAFVGTALEWYDYFLFGTAAAIVFNKLFFSSLQPSVAVLAALATFGVGFAARPVGAFLFGIVGDRIGRRPTLIITIVLIGCGTGAIGLLPTYVSAGVLAPALLVALRLVQGIAVGGEWGGATALAIEHAPARYRARYAALVQVGSPVGTLLSSGVFALVLLFPSDAFYAWGWRISFLIAFPMLLVALWIRLKVEETPIFKELVRLGERAKVSSLEVFAHSSGRLAVATAVALLGVGGFYMMNTFVVSYATNTLKVNQQVTVNATVIAAVVEIAVLIFSGRLAERVGSARVVFWGGVVSAVAAWPLFMLIDTKSPFAITLAMTLGIAFLSVTYAVTGALVGDLFPARTRYSGLALSYSIAGALSGFFPFIATWMIDATHTTASWPAVVLLVGVSVITAVGGLLGSRLKLHDEQLVHAV